MIFLGDTHGNWNILFYRIIQRDIRDVTIYHVGDIGIGFTKPVNEMNNLTKYNEDFKERNIIFYGIRGNHDDPKYFDGSIDMSNLKLLPDYTVVEIEGKNVLGVGGAVSIDRVPRMRDDAINIKYGSSKRCWWEGERFKLDIDKAQAMRDIDIVVTHTAPEFCTPMNFEGFPPIVERFASDDLELKSDLTKLLIGSMVISISVI
jgi:Icc-related predicted phosphoesterase